MLRFRAIIQDSNFSMPISVYCYVFTKNLKTLPKRLMGSVNLAKLNKPTSLISPNNTKIQTLSMNGKKSYSLDVYSNTKMIAAHCRDGRLGNALRMFNEMPVRDTVVWNSMIKGCLDCGELDMAAKVFDRMPGKNVVSWTTMVNGFFRFGKVEVAERLFWNMPVRDEAAWNSMIHGYCSSGRVEEGFGLFERMPRRNVISWTSMIGGLDQNGKSSEALSLFEKMVNSGVVPTSSTFAVVLIAGANVMDLRTGVVVHGCIVKLGYCLDEYISSSLITLYANCQEIKDALKVFRAMLCKNVVIWTALLTGFGSTSRHEDALKVLAEMIRENVFPNQASFTSALNSCCGLGALELGKQLHTVAVKLGLEADVTVGNSLIVMYYKCGNINDGVDAFKYISGKNTVSWNSILVGCAQHGRGKWALSLFSQMLRNVVDPDEVTLTGLLSACSHAGMLQKGRRIFEYFSLYRSFNMKSEHYACMVDLLGRSGKLEEAEDLIRNMPFKANTTVWLALLSACRMHSNIKVAERAANLIFDQDSQCSAAYVLLSNLYASAGWWDDVSKMRLMMKQRGITKQRGCSWVTLKGFKHEFLSGDRSHPLTNKIYEKLDWLRGKLKELGYVPDQRCALHDVEDEQKETMLSYHSERLAIGFGLLCTVKGSTIVVMKNLRVCEDCHSAIKLIAKAVQREIIVRDPVRFHHFKNGLCSCGDYW